MKNILLNIYNILFLLCFFLLSGNLLSNNIKFNNKFYTNYIYKYNNYIKNINDKNKCNYNNEYYLKNEHNLNFNHIIKIENLFNKKKYIKIKNSFIKKADLLNKYNFNIKDITLYNIFKLYLNNTLESYIHINNIFSNLDLWVGKKNYKILPNYSKNFNFSHNLYDTLISFGIRKKINNLVINFFFTDKHTNEKYLKRKNVLFLKKYLNDIPITTYTYNLFFKNIIFNNLYLFLSYSKKINNNYHNINTTSKILNNQKVFLHELVDMKNDGYSLGLWYKLKRSKYINYIFLFLYKNGLYSNIDLIQDNFIDNNWFIKKPNFFEIQKIYLYNKDKIDFKFISKYIYYYKGLLNNNIIDDKLKYFNDQTSMIYNNQFYTTYKYNKNIHFKIKYLFNFYKNDHFKNDIFFSNKFTLGTKIKFNKFSFTPFITYINIEKLEKLQILTNIFKDLFIGFYYKINF